MIKRPMKEETWAFEVAIEYSRDFIVGDRVPELCTPVADVHAVTYRDQALLAHTFHALREPSKHQLALPAVFALGVAHSHAHLAAAATVRHRNIVAVRACAFTSARALHVPRWVLVDPPVDGAQPLDALLAERGAMPVAPVDARTPFYALALQLALALAHLHGAACRVSETPCVHGRPPIAHGALRSDHVLVAPDTEYVINRRHRLGGHLQLAALGTARVAHECTWAPLERSEYCAPEPIAAGQVASTAAVARDAYAMGCVLLEMTTGARPPASHADRQHAARALAARTEQAEDGGGGGSGDSRAALLMLNMLETEPAKRPSAAAVAEKIYSWILPQT
jgi:hypothetical protein